MSSHCNRYPGCGCNSSVGTKCQLPEGDVRLLEKEPEIPGGNPWEDFKAEVEKLSHHFTPKVAFKKQRRKVTNIAPKKNKRKK